MKKKIMAGLLATTMTLGTLTGCGSSSTSSSKTDNVEVEMAAANEVSGTEITFWHSMGGSVAKAMDELVDRFNEENEYGITVNAQYQGEYDDSLNKLKSAQIGNMGADLVQVYEMEHVS